MSSNLPAESRPERDAALDVAPEPPSGYTPPSAVTEEEQAVDIRRRVEAVLRHPWLLAVCTVLGAVAGWGAWKLRGPVYQAQATIWVEAAPGRGGPIQQGQLLENTNWLDLLRSYTVLDSVVKVEHLFVTPDDAADTAVLRSFDLKDRFRPGKYRLEVDGTGRSFTLSSEGSVVQQGVVGDSVGSVVGFAWVPPGSALHPKGVIKFTVTTPRQAALDISDRLQARLPVENGNFIRLTLTGTVPATTASTLNSVTEQFVHVAADLKRVKLSELSRILNEQLQQAALDLRRAEVSLEGFRVHTITLPSDVGTPVAAGVQETQAPALRNFFEMKTQSEQLRRDREAIQRVMQQPPDSGITAVTLEAIPSVRSATGLSGALADLTQRQAQLRALLTRFTESNPQVQRLAGEIQTIQRQTIPALLNTLLTELEAREGQLNDQISSASRDLRQIPTRSIEEARLRREVTIADQLYTTLQQRYSEARLAEASSIPDVRILDPAIVPDKPLKNLMLMFLLGGTAGGLGLAIAIALGLEQFDRRLRYPDQVTRGLGLTILGALPRVKTGTAGLKSDGAAQVVEALRSIRLNLVHAYGAAGPLVTTVTSPGSGDGKSFLASNLALSFADAGHRTLLIDGDIRRGTLHRVLGANRKPGLLDFLSGQATREQVVQQTRIASVDFIGCGTRKIGGPELLASATMSQLLLGLRAQYGVIILDCAPLGAGVDPLVLGSLTGSLVMVLRTGVTDRELALAKLDDLYRLPIRVLGAVLNDVKAGGAYRYYSYLPGYHSGDEAEAERGEPQALPAGKSSTTS